MRKNRYYWRCVKTAWKHSYGRVDAITSFIGLFGPPFAKLAFGVEVDMNGSLAWQMFAGLAIAFFLGRLALAPYWIHQEDEAAIEKGKAERERLSGILLAKKISQETRETLNAHLRNADRLVNAHVTDANEMMQWAAAYQQWVEAVCVDLNKLLSFGETHFFSSTSGSMQFLIYNHKFSDSHNAALNELVSRTRNLRSIIERLPMERA
jgi:hypothetical protein